MVPATPSASSSTAGPPIATPDELPLRFAGSGSEYLRIWAVNMLLTVLTLGIYSAWAKVRREKFFHQNTRLADAGFDYHGKPLVILRGRLVALGLLALAQLDFVPASVRGTATLLLLAILPLLMQRSLRFRLANTSYRGVRFGFSGSVWGAYRLFGGYLLLALLWLGVVGGALSQVIHTPLAALLSPLLVLGLLALVPMLHASWRRYVTDHTTFGMETFSVQLRRRDFVWIYLQAIGVCLAVAACVAGVVAASGTALDPRAAGEGLLTQGLLFGAGLLLYGAVSSVSPIISARVQNLCGNRTRIGPHRLASRLAVAAFVRLQLLNLLLTIVTLGLYRPFAAVANARMRVGALALLPDGGIDDILASIEAGRDIAIGSEAVDLLGIDLSL